MQNQENQDQIARSIEIDRISYKRAVEIHNQKLAEMRKLNSVKSDDFISPLNKLKLYRAKRKLAKSLDGEEELLKKQYKAIGQPKNTNVIEVGLYEKVKNRAAIYVLPAWLISTIGIPLVSGGIVGFLDTKDPSRDKSLDNYVLQHSQAIGAVISGVFWTGVGYGVEKGTRSAPIHEAVGAGIIGGAVGGTASYGIGYLLFNLGYGIGRAYGSSS